MIHLQKHIQVLCILLALVCASTSIWANTVESDLIKAATDGDLSRVKSLIAAKADVNAKDTSGYTALMMASRKGHVEVVQALIAAKADVNAKADTGLTAMEIASLKGHLYVVQLLKEAGAGSSPDRSEQSEQSPSDSQQTVQESSMSKADKVDVIKGKITKINQAANTVVVKGKTFTVKAEEMANMKKGEMVKITAKSGTLNAVKIEVINAKKAMQKTNATASTTISETKQKMEDVAEKTAWESAEKTGTPTTYKEYYQKYPTSPRIKVVDGTLQGRWSFKLGAFNFNTRSMDQIDPGVLVTVEGMSVCARVSLDEAKRLNIIASSPADTSGSYKAETEIDSSGVVVVTNGVTVVDHELVEPKKAQNSIIVLSADGTRLLTWIVR